MYAEARKQVGELEGAAKAQAGARGRLERRDVLARKQYAAGAAGSCPEIKLK